MIVRLPCLGRYPVPAERADLWLVTKLVHTKTGHFQASLAVVPLPDLPRRQISAVTYILSSFGAVGQSSFLS